MKSLRYWSALLSFALVFGVLSLYAGAGQAFAQVTRVAVVKELKGTVKVKKSGGSKAFNAFKNMSLNEGDSLTTGEGAKVVLELADAKADKDEMTVGGGSQITFTKLEGDNGAKAKMNVWAGSLWIKVKSISNANDQFEIETPTAIMGVRGTHFLTQVDKKTGLTTMFVAAGVVQATIAVDGPAAGRQQSNESKVLVYPAQQLSLSPQSGTESVKSVVSYVDTKSIVTLAPPSIIEAIIRNAADIAEENESLKEKWEKELAGGGSGSFPPPVDNQSDLNRLSGNLDRLLGNIAKDAVDSAKLEKKLVEELVDQINAGADRKLIDLANVKPFELSDKEKQELERRKRLEDEAARLKAEEQRLLDEANARLAALLRQIEQERMRLQLEAEKLSQEKKAKAEQQFLSRLSAAQQQEFKKNKEQNQSQAGTGTNPTQGTGGSNPGNSRPLPKAALMLNGSSSTLKDPAHGTPLLLDLKFSGFGTAADRKIYGYQIRVEYESDHFYFDSQAFDSHTNSYRTNPASPFKVEPKDGWTLPYQPESVDHYFVTRDASDKEKSVTYAVAAFKMSGYNIESETTLVTLPFRVNHPAVSVKSSVFRIAEIIAVDKEGKTIASYTPANAGAIAVTNATVGFELTRNV